MSATVGFTAVYEDVEGGWVQARLAEIPGVVTAAPTREAATGATATTGTPVNVTVTAA